MKRRQMRLTLRGKRTLIMGLTLAGCLMGVIVSVLLSLIHIDNHQTSYVFACETEGEREKGEDRQSQKTSCIELRSQTVGPQWLFYQSRVDDKYKGEQKAYLDRLVNRWTKGKLTDDELSEQMRDFLNRKKVPVTSAGVQSKMLCLFPSANELPDYTAMLEESGGIYNFIGVYTDGEKDEEDRLICYYWEAGVQ